MDPALASIIVAAFGLIGGIGVALISARFGAERLMLQDRIRRLERHIVKLGGDPDDA